MLQYTCFNIFHQLYFFVVGTYGQRLAWPNIISLIPFFEYYEANLWYWAGAALQNEERQNGFIDGWPWVISNRSHGHQAVVMNDEQREAVETFKLFFPRFANTSR